jgi:hypothetical protein
MKNVATKVHDTQDRQGALGISFPQTVTARADEVFE